MDAREVNYERFLYIHFLFIKAEMVYAFDQVVAGAA